MQLIHTGWVYNKSLWFRLGWLSKQKAFAEIPAGFKPEALPQPSSSVLPWAWTLHVWRRAVRRGRQSVSDRNPRHRHQKSAGIPHRRPESPEWFLVRQILPALERMPGSTCTRAGKFHQQRTVAIDCGFKLFCRFNLCKHTLHLHRSMFTDSV